MRAETAGIHHREAQSFSEWVAYGMHGRRSRVQNSCVRCLFWGIFRLLGHCFLPFGGYINEKGGVVHMGAQIEGEEHSLPSDLLRVLRKELADLAISGKARATGIVFDVMVAVPPAKVKSDAIQIDLDHREHYSARVYHPYTMEAKGACMFAPIFACQGDGEMFAV